MQFNILENGKKAKLIPKQTKQIHRNCFCTSNEKIDRERVFGETDSFMNLGIAIQIAQNQEILWGHFWLRLWIWKFEKIEKVKVMFDRLIDWFLCDFFNLTTSFHEITLKKNKQNRNSEFLKICLLVCLIPMYFFVIFILKNNLKW